MKRENLLGAHMSIAGGIEKSLYSAASIDCTAMQIFTHSNRRWAMSNPTQESIEKFNEARIQTGITHIIIHASYLINLGSEKEDIVNKSVHALNQELNIANDYAIDYVVLHPGSGQQNQEATIKQIAELINKIFKINKTKINILLENMAGQGNQVAHTFEQLALLRSLISDKKRIGFCLDTCHAWAAGYDFSTPSKYKTMWQDFDSILGIDNLKAIHLNDSKNILNSHVDRHAEIGKGKIGLETFELIMNDNRLDHIPKVLETPKKDLDDYSKNLKLLRSLIK